jgi:hypothetical protein
MNSPAAAAPALSSATVMTVRPLRSSSA